MDLETRISRRPAPRFDFSEGTYREPDEVSFADLWARLVRQKKIVLAVFFIVVFSATAFGLVLPPLYDSRAVLQLGNFEALSPEDLVEQLKEEHRLNDGADRQRELPYITSVKLNKSTKNVVVLTAQGRTPTEAQNFLNDVVAQAISSYSALNDKARRQGVKNLEGARARLAEAEKQRAALDKQILMVNQTSPVSAGVLTIKMGALLEHIVTLERWYARLEGDLDELDIKAPKVIRDPSLPFARSAPKRAWYAISGVVIGLILSVVTGLLVDFYHVKAAKPKVRAHEAIRTVDN